MTYKIQNEERKSETPPPRNSERLKEPTAEDEDVVKDEKQVQKETFKNIPAPSSLYNICMFLHSQDKELEKLIKDLQCLGREEDGVIGRFEASCQLDYSNNPMLSQGTAMQDREANRKLLLEELRQLSAGFRQKQDEAFRRFKSKIWRPPISKIASGVKTANIKQPLAAEETMETSSSAETTTVAPVAFKEERSLREERETLNIPVSTGLSKNSACSIQDKSCMEEEVMITTEGGLIEIQDTGVSLEIPPGALEEEQLIKMRIVSDDYHDDLAVSFGSNASVVVELLPSNLPLLKPAKLTLPHCLVLNKGCKWEAKIFTSHHVKGNQPLWEEDLFASCELHESFCLIWLQCFCWKKFFVSAKIVKALEICLFAAKRPDCTRFTSDEYVDVGFYLDIPYGQEAAKLRAENILHEQQTSFYMKGGLPLKILFDKDSPSIWTSPTLPNPKEIAFQRVATSSSCHSTFVLKEQTNLEITDVTCNFKAGQGTDLLDLIFPLQIWRPQISKFASGVKPAKIKQPPAAEETVETSSSAKTMEIPSKLCSAHLSISAGGPPPDFAVTSTCYKCIAVLQYVAEEVADKWKDVGRNLKLTEAHLKIIMTDYKLCKEQSFQMLMKWTEICSSDANYMVLGKALAKDGRLDLQQNLELKLQE